MGEIISSPHHNTLRNIAVLGGGTLLVVLGIREINAQLNDTILLGQNGKVACSGTQEIDVSFGEPRDEVIARDAQRLNLRPENASYLLDLYAKKNPTSIFTVQNGIDVLEAKSVLSAETCTD